VYKTRFGYLLVALVVSFSAQALETRAGADQHVAGQSNDFKDGPQPAGKGPGMGRDYQKATPGPGQGEPDHRGGKSGIEAPAQESAPLSQGPSTRGEVADPFDEGRGRSVGRRDGRGVGTGYPGYRGQGKDGSPHHRQYASPPRNVAQ